MNFAKLDEALAYIEEHPDEHYQSAWISRRERTQRRGWFRRPRVVRTTAACLAGRLALLDGWQPVWSRFFDGYTTADSVEKGGVVRAVSDVAQEILGLADHAYFETSGNLFMATRSLADLRHERDVLFYRYSRSGV